MSQRQIPEILHKAFDNYKKLLIEKLGLLNSIFLKNNKIKNLLLDYYRIGYEKDIFDDLISKIKDKICVQNILDSFYDHSWEHCKKGFFKFNS